jgi:hypothetical protein
MKYKKIIILVGILSGMGGLNGVAQQVGPFEDFLSPLFSERTGKYGYIGTTGRFVIPLQYGNAGDFSEGLAPVKVGGKWGQSQGAFVGKVYGNGRWGYINKKGEMVIKPQFVDRQHSGFYDPGAFPFSEGLALVNIPFKKLDLKEFWIDSFFSHWTYIDKMGKVAVNIEGEVFPFPNEFSGSFAGRFSEGLAVYGCAEFGFIDRKGVDVIKPVYAKASPYSEGLAAVAIKREDLPAYRDIEWGYIDKTGKVVIPFQYEGADSFSEGMAPVNKHRELTGFTNRKGQWVIKPQFQWAGPFSEGRAVVAKQIAENMRYGFIDKKGKTVIDYIFDAAAPFKEWLAGVEIKGKWGYIDKSGKIVIKPQFDEAYGFSDGLARVWMYDKSSEH